MIKKKKNNIKISGTDFQRTHQAHRTLTNSHQVREDHIIPINDSSDINTNKKGKKISSRNVSEMFSEPTVVLCFQSSQAA